jgi:hypothetical protein
MGMTPIRAWPIVANMSDGLNMLPRIGEPESSAGLPERAAGGLLALSSPNIPDTSGPGPTPLQQPGTWNYDFNPADGIARATFNGEVVPSGGGAAGVSSFNTRTGDVTLSPADIAAAGGAPIASPAFTGNPTAPTAVFGDSDTTIATTQFVQGAIANHPEVSSFNGRTGAVTLTTGDVTGAGGAPLASPALSGVPTAPTASAGDTSSQIATDAFVAAALAGGAVTSFNGRHGTVSLALSDVVSVGGAPIASPNFTGTPSGPTAAPGAATTQLATTEFVTDAITGGTAGVASFNTRTGAVVLTVGDLASVGGAPLLSPVFTGTPSAPTPGGGDNSTHLATTAYVQTAIAGQVNVDSFNGRTGVVVLTTADVTSAGGAPLASPALTGTPSAPTPTPGDNSTRIATTAFVEGQASTTTPAMDGTAAIGTGLTWARADHVHPSDTSRLPLTGGTLTGALTPAQVAGIVGTTTNNNAAAGSIGEYVTASGASVPFTNNVQVNIASITLTPGDWDVNCNCSFSPSTSNLSTVQAGISSTSGVLPAFAQKAVISSGSANLSVTNIHVSPQRFLLTTTTTIFLVADASFTSGTCSGDGTIRARRMR